METLVKYFYEIHFKETYGYPSLRLTLPTENVDWVSKCRIIIPELDSISKQYNLFVEEGDINQRLIQLGKPLQATEVKSLFRNKYYTIKGSPAKIMEPMNLLYGKTEILHVINGFDTSKINNFYEFITSFEVPYSAYEKDYRKKRIDCLISYGCIKIDEQGILRVDREAIIEILNCLWRNNVISYWHHNNAVRELLDKWYNEGLLEIDGHLLCESERNLFCYYLNNKFTNGLAIRNHYVHGSISLCNDTQVHAQNYHILLLLLILLLLKIEDEFRIGLKILSEHLDKTYYGSY